LFALFRAVKAHPHYRGLILAFADTQGTPPVNYWDGGGGPILGIVIVNKEDLPSTPAPADLTLAHCNVGGLALLVRTDGTAPSAPLLSTPTLPRREKCCAKPMCH
jgi:hypothetical protein